MPSSLKTMSQFGLPTPRRTFTEVGQQHHHGRGRPGNQDGANPPLAKPPFSPQKFKKCFKT
eukprot:1078143-Amphidinium_carterae.1